MVDVRSGMWEEPRFELSFADPPPLGILPLPTSHNDYAQSLYASRRALLTRLDWS